MPAPAVYVPSRVGEGYFTDFQAPAAGATDTGKVWAWNSSTAKFEPVTPTVYETAGAVATHAALTTTHGVSGAIVGTTNSQALSNKTLTTPTIASFVNANHDHSNSAGGGTLSGYLLATGATTGGTSSRQQFTSGLKVGSLQPISDGITAYQIQATGGTVAINVDTTNNRVGFGGNVAPAQAVDVTGSVKLSTALIGPIWGPAADSTTAIKVTKADLSTSVLTVDTTNARVGIGKTPTVSLDVRAASQGAVGIVVDAASGGSIELASGDASNTGYIAWRKSGGSTRLGYMGYSGTDVVLTLENSAKFVVTGGNMSIGQASATALLDIAASTTARASLRIRSGVAPTSPNDGEIWFDNTNIYIRINGVTKTFTVT